MTKPIFSSRIFSLLLVLSLLLPYAIVQTSSPTMTVQAATPPQAVVAIHVSELTQALEGMPAESPTPTGTGYSGNQWFLTSWHYFVIYESLKIALESDGTPYVLVSDADIIGGGLRNLDGTPKYPIVFSLANEAVADEEIQPLLDYVNAGGYLFMGSSAFTRNPDGTTRGDFALASEMGLNMVNHNLQNWTFNSSFTRSETHRLVSHIPSGTVSWDMLMNAEDIVWGSNGSQHLWQVVANGAEVIATGGSRPLLATNDYGSGRFIYHAILNPLVGAGGYDSGMYAYTIYRSAVEWAFEAANLPIIKRSPWPYTYDAAFMVRHDFENYLGSLTSIAASAQYEQSKGARGDYYFCTGILRTLDSTAQQAYIESMISAIEDYGATIGSHNGGYPNIGVTDANSYDYWHWGPDTMLDQTSGFPVINDADGNAYTNGYDYSKDSIQISFQDLERWFAGVDNGRPGCGADENCPRTWVSPYFNSGRDGAFKMFEELGAKVMGEQKVSPFPHWTLSYDPTNPDHRYSIVTLPPSDWYVGSGISQSIEGHNSATIQDLVDFYYEKGYLMNLYGHSGSTSGNMKSYVDDATAKPRMWATNAVGLYDWWVKRDSMLVTPGYSTSGDTAIATATISGDADAQAAIELVLPHWSSGAIGDLQVNLNGAPAGSTEYRVTNYGVKVQVGTAIHSVEVRYTPLAGWVQTDWAGGPGQTTWSDPTQFASASRINNSLSGQISLNLAGTGASLFSEDFTRAAPPDPTPVPFTWTTAGIPGNYGVFNTSGQTLNTSLSAGSQYGFAYKDTPTQPAGDYTIETDIRFPNTTNGGGIFGRLNPATGTRYAIWVYPPSTLRLIRFNSWPGSPWVDLGSFTIPSVGTSWHHLKMVFNGSNIQVFYDNGATPTHNVTDPNYSSGYAGLDYWSSTTYGPSYNNYVVKDNLGDTIFSDDFGVDPTVPDLLPPWSAHTGAWSVTNNTLQSTAGGTGGYAQVFYNPDPAWADYSVQARVQYPSGAFGGGLVGRLNPTTGTRYTAWVYPGTTTLNLLKWSDWTTWESITTAGIPVGTDWHTVKMEFSGSNIRVYWDNSLVIDANDNSSPYLSGGVGFDTFAQGGAYLIAADDVAVSGPVRYEASGMLTSSAFDGGVGAVWYDIAYDAAVPASTSLCVRTRTADRSDQLSESAWSDCYPASGASVASPDRRWIQYQVELETSDPSITPFFSEIGITYSAGSYLPQSSLVINNPVSSDSQTLVTLSATLLDEGSNPISGRTVSFTLGGLPLVSGTTNASGIATASLTLNMAPGLYPLAATFTSDGVFGPSSANTSFTVTESWSEWIQDSSADFGSGTGNGVDVNTRSGSVILAGQQFGAGEESGAFQLGSESWAYRRRIYIDNPNSSQLPTGYSLKLILDTAGMTTAGKLRTDGNDLRLVWTGGGATLELDRVADTDFNLPATEIWFKSQAAIPTSSRDSSYFIYYGNPGAGTPLADPANIFAIYDGFDDTTVNSTLWTQTGTVTESDGWARLSAGGNLFGKQSFTYGILEMRIQASAENNYMWWGWEDGASDAPNFIVFEDYPAPTYLAALLRNKGAPYLTFTPTQQPSGGLTIPHTYATEWRPGQARWFVDGSQVQGVSSGVPDTAMSANFNAFSLAYDVDWVRGRLLAGQEPIVSLSSTYYGFASQGTFISQAWDTGSPSDWKYLVWEGLSPAGTGLTLRLRTASTQAGLATAAWESYPQTGLLITNPAARWIQYAADLSTNDTLVTPELGSITIYFISGPNNPPTIPATFYGMVHFTPTQPDPGTLVEVSVPGISGVLVSTPLTLEDPDLVYLLDVPGDNPDTPQKEGAANGDLVTFSIGGRVIASAPWVSSEHIRVDLNSTAILLQPGWNLVSFNLHPAVTTPADVLAGLAGRYDLVYAWNAAAPGGPWLLFAPGNPYYANNLAELDETMGFWIHVTPGDALTLYVTGSLPTNTSIPLSATTGGGWNLVGFPSQGNLALPTVLSANGVGDNFSLLYAYDASLTSPWLMFDRNAPDWVNDLSALTPGRGYWIKVSANVTWTVP